MDTFPDRDLCPRGNGHLRSVLSAVGPSCYFPVVYHSCHTPNLTNKGTYRASTGKFTGNEEVGEDYIKNINGIVNNRIAMSKQIVANNYYSKLKIK